MTSEGSFGADSVKMPCKALLQDDRSVFSDLSLRSDQSLEGFTSQYPSRSGHLLLSPAMQVSLRNQRRGSFHSTMPYTNRPSFNLDKQPHRLSTASSSSSFSFLDEDDDDDIRISPDQEASISSLDRLIKDLEEFQILCSDDLTPSATQEYDQPRRNSDPDVSSDFEKGLFAYLDKDRRGSLKSHEHLQTAITDLGSPRDVGEIDYEIAKYAGLDSPYSPYDDCILEGYGADSEEEEEEFGPISPSQYRSGTRIHNRCSLIRNPPPFKSSFASKGKKPEMQLGLGSAPADMLQISLPEGKLRPRRVTIAESRLEEWGDPYARKRESQKSRFHFSPRVPQRARAMTTSNVKASSNAGAVDAGSDDDCNEESLDAWRKRNQASPTPKRMASIGFVDRRLPAAVSHDSPILRSFSHAPRIVQQGEHHKRNVPSPSEWMSTRPIALPTRKKHRNGSATLLMDDEVSPRNTTRSCSTLVTTSSSFLDMTDTSNSDQSSPIQRDTAVGLGLSIERADDDDHDLFTPASASSQH